MVVIKKLNLKKHSSSGTTTIDWLCLSCFSLGEISEYPRLDWADDVSLLFFRSFINVLD